MNKLNRFLTLSIPLLLLMLAGCKSHYSYSSEPNSPIRRVKTDISTLEFVYLKGVNIQSADRWNFKTYLKKELKKNTFITLDSSSPNKLYITATITPLVTKRYKDIFFKVDQFHVDKSASMLVNYKIKDKNGDIMLSDVYSIDIQKSEVSNIDYREAERKHLKNDSINKLHKKMMRGLAKSVVSHIIENRGLK